MGPPPSGGILNDSREIAAALSAAEDAARAAGELLMSRFGGPATGVEAKSTPTDLVSEADLEAERIIRDRLALLAPGQPVLGEEGGADDAGASGPRWVVDPLDGTINFLFGIPHWAVSVACEDDDGAVAGVVFDPCRGELFAGFRGGEATLDGVAVEPSSRDELATALVATGFAYDAAVRERQAAVAARVLPRVRDLRRFGSAALDLAWTAAGRYDAYYERNLQPWDRAAGAFICALAGLTLVELGADGDLPAGLLVAPPALAESLAILVA